MSGKHWTRMAATMTVLILSLSGCQQMQQQDIAHQRSMAELNQKAQAMLQSGDVNGAVARLESAHDLSPDEPNTSYNLAVAYQAQGNYDKALEMFQQVQDKPGLNKAEIQKSIAITLEARADKTSDEAKKLEDGPKPDAAKIAPLKQSATQDYQQAIEFYKQALPGLKNAQDQQAVQTQITALEARLQGKGAAAIE
jgi:tetratricopeptide (TPR) repeat protein